MLNIISFHERFQMGNIVFKDAVIEWRRTRLEDDAFTEEEAEAFADHLADIGLGEAIKGRKTPPILTIRFNGIPHYGAVVQSNGVEVLTDVLTDEDTEVFLRITTGEPWPGKK